MQYLGHLRSLAYLLRRSSALVNLDIRFLMNSRYGFEKIGRMIALSAIAVACSSDSDLQPFSSDGCSLFPDSSLIAKVDWCSCCFEHDLVYWRGGTSEEREVADAQLKECVLGKTGDETLATLMYEGVKLGGSPYFYNWYRWGYGWDYDRKYQALTPAEQNLADKLMVEYFASEAETVCPN